MKAAAAPVWVRRLLGFPVLAVKRRELARFRGELTAARAVQARVLSEVLAAMAGSAFARDHGLAKVRSAADLAAALPVAGYDRVAPYIERVRAGEVAALFRPGTRILMFATTSGTTAAVKFIPVTPAVAAAYQRSWTIWGCAVAEAHPLTPYGGVINLASPWRSGRAPSGAPCGSITGLLLETMHRTLKVTNAIPPAAAAVEDPGDRQYLALRLALARPDVMMVTTANPSTLLGFARRMEARQDDLLRDLQDGGVRGAPALPPGVAAALRAELSPAPKLARRLAASAAAAGALVPRVAWPRLTLLGVWTGGTLSSYLPRLPAYYGPLPLRDHGLSASEGRLTIPLADGTADGPLNVSGGYFEFIPEAEYGQPNARILGAHELDGGGRYYVVVSTMSGLLRYDLHDVVECTGYLAAAPLLRFLHKGRDVANLTGEKLSAHQVAEALQEVQRHLGLTFGEVALAPEIGDPPRYHLLIEAPEMPPPSEVTRLAAALDRELAARNSEYAEKRRSDRLAPVTVTAAAAGTFAALRAARLAASAGPVEQYKHPFLVTDPAFVGKARLRLEATF